MQESIKIVFTGTVGAGKTQAIQQISDIDIVNTDVFATDDVQLMKEKTTVAMDYGEVTLDENTTLALYGTPGQKRFRHMWDILAQGALGIIIMVDNQRENPLEDLQIYIENFAPYIEQSCAIVAVTHTDIKDTPDLKCYQDYMYEQQLPYPVFSIDARNKEQVLLLIQSMMAILDVQ